MHRYPTKEYIREQISSQLFGEGGDEISISSIEKDIIAMRDDDALGYNAPIKYDRTHRGYYYDDPNYSIDGLGLNEQDSEALREAASVLNLFTEIPIFANLKEAIEKINTRFSLSTDLGDPVIDQYVQFEQAVTAKGKEWIKPIYEAIANRQPIRFKYNNVYKNESREHQSDPYLLKEVRNKWYMIGWNNKHADFTTYALDRISELQTTGVPFKYRRDFNPDDFYKYSMGIMEGPKPKEKIVLELYGPIARLIEISPIHHTQEVKIRKEGLLRIELEIAITEELIRQLLSLSNCMKVIKPARLKKWMKTELETAMKYY